MPTQQEIDDFKLDVTKNVDNKTKRATIKRVKIGGFYRTIADWFASLSLVAYSGDYSDLINKPQAESFVITTSGEITSSNPKLIINWNNDIVPGGTTTWLEKHGSLKNVLIETERPSPLSLITQQEINEQNLPQELLEKVFFQPSLDYYRSNDYKWLVLDNGGDNMRWLIFSKAKTTPDIPGSNSYMVDDYVENDYVE